MSLWTGLVARVVVDVPLAHLDRPFDYAVPESMADDVVPGCRVRVRFAGQLVDGFVLALGEGSEHGGKLAPPAQLVSAEPGVTPQGAAPAPSVAGPGGGAMFGGPRPAGPPRP